MTRQARQELLAAAFILFLLALAALFTGCARPHHPPDYQPPAVLEAHLTATPPITIAGRVVTLHAWLDDPGAVVHCPGVTWTWPNGTRSSHVSDCEPEEHETRHSDVKRGALPAGEHHFAVTFDSEGHAWTAETTVEVH